MPPEFLTPHPRLWPEVLRTIPSRRLADGRRVVTSQFLSALLGCTPANLRQMAASGNLRREADLDEPRRSWYTVEEVARVYFRKYPGAALNDEDDALHARLWPGLAPQAVPPSRPVEIPPELAGAGADEGAARAAADEVPLQESRPESAAEADKDAVIARLTSALADKDAEVQRLKAWLADPRRRTLRQRRLPKG